MNLLVLSEHDVERLLPYDECIPVMEEALAALARGQVHNPLRQAIRAPGAGGLLGLMPAWWGGGESFYGLKEVCVFPENPKKGLDTHLGAVILHSGETGEPLAVINASAVTAIRTAAVSAVATKLLARKDAGVLAVIGAGVQGRAHLAAIPLVRKIREVRVYSRGNSQLVNCGSVEEAVRGRTSSSRRRTRGIPSLIESGFRTARTSTPSDRASRARGNWMPPRWRARASTSTGGSRP